MITVLFTFPAICLAGLIMDINSMIKDLNLMISRNTVIICSTRGHQVRVSHRTKPTGVQRYSE